MGGKAGSKDTRPDEMAETDTSAHANAGPSRPTEADLARDWITIWQSELAATSMDPETMRSWRTVVQAWSSFATWVLQVMPKAAPTSFDDAKERRSRPEPPAWPAPVAVAPDARDDEIARLTHHIDQLERRLADLERRVGSRPAVDPKRRRSRDV